MLGKYMFSLIFDVIYKGRLYPGYTILIDPSKPLPSVVYKKIITSTNTPMKKYELDEISRFAREINEEINDNYSIGSDNRSIGLLLTDPAGPPWLVDWYSATVEIPILWIRNGKDVISGTTLFIYDSTGVKTRLAIGVLANTVSFTIGEWVSVEKKYLQDFCVLAAGSSGYWNITVKIMWKKWLIDTSPTYEYRLYITEFIDNDNDNEIDHAFVFGDPPQELYENTSWRYIKYFVGTGKYNDPYLINLSPNVLKQDELFYKAT